MASMHSYLVTMISRTSLKEQQIVINSLCEHGMQEFVDELHGLEIEEPVVVDIHDQEYVKDAV